MVLEEIDMGPIEVLKSKQMGSEGFIVTVSTMPLCLDSARGFLEVDVHEII